MRWTNLEPIIQSEVSQKEKDKHHILMHINSYNGETDIKNRLMDMGRREKRVRNMERVTWRLTLP